MTREDFIIQQKYVLTPDFAVKLLLVHERLKAGQAVILSGDTVLSFLFLLPDIYIAVQGVGKTELFNLYSVIINADSTHVPDILDLFYEFIYSTLLLNHGAARTPAFLEKQHLKKTANDRLLANFQRYVVTKLPMRNQQLGTKLMLLCD